MVNLNYRTQSRLHDFWSLPSTVLVAEIVMIVRDLLQERRRNAEVPDTVSI